MEPGVTIVAVSLAAVALAAGAELAARRWIRARAMYYVFAPGHRLRQLVDRETLPQLEPVARVEINREGERGPEVPEVQPGERLYRVLVAGGSQPEGHLLDQDTTWPGALGRMLAEPERLQTLGVSRVHVGSIAKSGVGTEALDTILKRVLPRYPHLSAIVILVGASDMLRWLEEGAPPSAPSAAVPTAELFRWHPEHAFDWRRPRTLAFVEVTKRLLSRLPRGPREHAAAGRWLRQARSMRARARVIRATVPNPAVMLAHFETHLRVLVALAQRHADRVIVVQQPWYGKDPLTPEESAQMWHGGVGRAWREEVTTFFSIDVTARLMAMVNARAACVAADLGVESVDLMPVLEPSLDTYYDFFHLTPAGARVVAAAIAGAITQPARMPVGDVRSCVDLRAS
jgi:lysophospholipase L1-like esterase